MRSKYRQRELKRLENPEYAEKRLKDLAKARVAASQMSHAQRMEAVYRAIRRKQELKVKA